MISLLFLAVVAFFLYRLLGGAPQLSLHRNHPTQATDSKIDELTEYASRLRASGKYRNAEKTYLQILKMDHRHAMTYTRLGTLYSKMQNPADAIECFQMATQLQPDGHTYYNLGLAYYENRNPIKAVAAFEKAIMFEPSAQRYVGLAKSFNRLHDGERMIESLERAAELDPIPKVLWLLADGYQAADRPSEMIATYNRIKALAPRDARLKTLSKEVKNAMKDASASLEKSPA